MNEWILNEWTGAGLIVTDESRDDQRSAAAAADAAAGASRLNAVGWIGWDRTALQLVLADHWYDLQPDTGRYPPAQLRVMHAIRSPRMAVFSGGMLRLIGDSKGATVFPWIPLPRCHTILSTDQ